MRPRSITPLLALVAAFATLMVGMFAPLSSAVEENAISAPDTVGEVGSFASMALDADGNPVVSYFDETNGDLKVLHCDDPACSGAGERIAMPDTEGEVGRATSLVLDEAGRPVVSYKEGERGALRLLRCGDGDCASGNSIVEIGEAPNVERDTSLILDEAGYPVIAYQAATEFRLVVVHCGSVDCSEGNTVALPDEVPYVGAYASIALDAEGNPTVGYRNGTSDDLSVLHCGNPTCTESNTISLPHTAGNIGIYPALTLDADGLPVIAYRHGVFLSLHLMRCGNASCSGDNTITAVHGASGRSNSLALDASGRPVIAYYGRRGRDLNLLRCLDRECTETTNELIEPIGDLPYDGNHVSLVLDAGDRPVVAYYDAEDADLKLIDCADPSCQGKLPTPTPTLVQPTPAPVRGDVTCDRLVTGVDAAVILQLHAGLPAIAPCRASADLTGDGVLTSLDAALILQFVTRLLPSLPA